MNKRVSRAAVLLTFLSGSLHAGSPEVLDDRITVELFAEQPMIVTPISIDVDSRGRVWVIESNTHFAPTGYKLHPSDRVLILEDHDGDGRADRRVQFCDGLTHAMGMKLLDDRRMLLATRREVFLYTDADADGLDPERRSLARLESKGAYPHNGLCGFAVDELGLVYFGFGENLGEDYRLVAADGSSVSGGGEGGSMFRMRADGSGLERLSTGYWNPFHHAFDAFGNLFVVDNDPDARPPCRLMHCVAGTDFGYRFRLGRGGLHPFSAWNGGLPGTVPMVSGTGEAPSGIVAYEGEGLPGDYQGVILGTSWGDHRIEAFRLEPQGASFKSSARAVVQGDQSFRPVGVAVAPDGSVYISDWVDKSYNVHGRGRIWRLRAKTRAPDRREPLVAPGTVALAKDRIHATGASDRARLQGVAFLARKKSLDATMVRELATRGASDDLLAAAVRLYADSRPEERGSSLADLLRYDIFRSHPRARMEALIRTTNIFGLENELRELAAKSPDPFLRSAALHALARSAPREVLDGFARSPDEDHRLVALLVMRRQGGCGRAVTPFVTGPLQSVGPSVVQTFLRDSSPRVRRAALQWVGDEKLSGLEKAVSETLEAGVVTREVFDAYLAATALLRGENPDKRGRKSRDAFLAGLALDGQRPAAVRELALRSVSSEFDWKPAQIDRLLQDRDAGLLRTVVRVVSDSTSSAALRGLTKVVKDPKMPANIRRQAIAGLSRFAENDTEARRLLVGFLLPAVSGEHERLRREAARGLRGVSLAQNAAVARVRLDGELLETTDPKRLEMDASLQEGGDAAEGELVFFHPRGPRCSSCHTIRARGGSVGPDLSTAGRLGRKKLLASILDPSREIAPRFATWTHVTRFGANVGLSLGESPDGKLRVGLASGQVIEIPRGELVERRANTESLMPTNLHGTMTKDELRDLLAYLASLE